MMTNPRDALLGNIRELGLPFEVPKDRGSDSSAVEQFHWMEREHPSCWMNSYKYS